MQQMRCGLLLIFCCMSIAIPAHASTNEALLELLNALHENGTINAETYEMVKQMTQRQTGASWCFRFMPCHWFL